MLIKFHGNGYYNGVTYEKGKVYDLPEELGFANRWIARGHEELKEFDGEILQDPRLPKKEKVKEVVVEKPVGEKKVVKKVNKKVSKKKSIKDKILKK